MSQNLTQTIVQRAKQAIKQVSLPDLQMAVSEEDHQAELNSLIEIIKHDKFFMVIDSANGKLSMPTVLKNGSVITKALLP